jgi:hypothetical protein
MTMRLSLLALLVVAGCATPLPPFAFSSNIDCQNPFYPYPRQYVAYKTTKDLVIDGRLDDPEWEAVGFTDSFVDISTNFTPYLDTRVKMRYDDEFLYIGFRSEEPAVWANITATCHCVNNTQDQVIFHDNDNEVFVDADGSTHFYKETEVNAYNNPTQGCPSGTCATWDLLLNKPYGDGGGENSTRVFGPDGFDMQPPLHVMTYTDGEINNPAKPSTFWSTELALPLAKLIYNTTATAPPRPGQMWRINFSRVEWAVKVVNGQYQKYPSCQSCPVPGTNDCDNWVWSPQGSIAMHLPERWGYLQFSDAPVNTTQPVRDPEFTVRSVAMAVYYAEHAFAAANNGTYTGDIQALFWFTADPHIFDGTCTAVPTISLSGNVTNGTGTAFTAYVASLDGSMTASVRDDRYLRVATTTIAG